MFRLKDNQPEHAYQRDDNGEQAEERNHLLLVRLLLVERGVDLVVELHVDGEAGEAFFCRLAHAAQGGVHVASGPHADVGVGQLPVGVLGVGAEHVGQRVGLERGELGVLHEALDACLVAPNEVYHFARLDARLPLQVFGGKEYHRVFADRVGGQESGARRELHPHYVGEVGTHFDEKVSVLLAFVAEHVAGISFVCT